VPPKFSFFFASVSTFMNKGRKSQKNSIPKKTNPSKHHQTFKLYQNFNRKSLTSWGISFSSLSFSEVFQVSWNLQSRFEQIKVPKISPFDNCFSPPLKVIFKPFSYTHSLIPFLRSSFSQKSCLEMILLKSIRIDLWISFAET